jgi:hypothetical protein
LVKLLLTGLSKKFHAKTQSTQRVEFIRPQSLVNKLGRSLRPSRLCVKLLLILADHLAPTVNAKITLNGTSPDPVFV